MPVLKSAKKALRQNKKRNLANFQKRSLLKKQVKKTKKTKEKKDLSVLFSLSDKAAKKGIIHKNKASRIKSRLSKMVSKK